jgi:hypothetical protein
MNKDKTMDVTDTAVEAIVTRAWREWKASNYYGTLPHFAVKLALSTLKPKPEDVKRLAEIMKGIHIPGLQPSWPDIARAILALYPTPPDHAEIECLRTRVRELEALTVEPPPRGTLTEDDVIRIAEQTYAAAGMRYLGGLPPWSKLSPGTKKRHINYTRDCLSAASYRVPKAIPKVHTETIGERADLLDSLDSANARIATLEAERDALAANVERLNAVGTVRLDSGLGEGLTEAQEARGPTAKLHQASCMDRIKEATKEFVWNETVQVRLLARLGGEHRTNGQGPPRLRRTEAQATPDYAHVADMLRLAVVEGRDAAVTALLSNNLNPILSALDIAAQGDRAGGV